jgi:cell division protein ZapA (FtsZ GTPase activity inhibitor)
MMQPQNTQHEFNLLGQKIVIKNQEEAELATLAIKIVNEKVSEIQERNPMLGPQQISVLALLEVAGNLVKDRKSIDEYRHELDRKCSSLMTEMSKVNSSRSNLVV